MARAPKSRPSIAPRKPAPRGRAAITVDALIIAAERLLEREGIEGVTTNRLAEVAGVSIGTLYQYFPNKQAIVAALIERTMTGYLEMFRMVLAGARDLPMSTVANGLVRGFRLLFHSQAKVHLALLEQTAALGLIELHARMLARYVAEVQSFLEGRPDLQVADPYTVAFVAVHATEGVIRSLSIGDAPVDDEAIGEHVVRLVLGYVLSSAQQAIPAARGAGG